MTTNPQELITRYDEAVEGLNKYNEERNLTPWQPNMELAKINNRCVYLYDDEERYAKFDSRLKVIVEYIAPGMPRLREVARREGDYGGVAIPRKGK